MLFVLFVVGQCTQANTTICYSVSERFRQPEDATWDFLSTNILHILLFRIRVSGCMYFVCMGTPPPQPPLRRNQFVSQAIAANVRPWFACTVIVYLATDAYARKQAGTACRHTHTHIYRNKRTVNIQCDCLDFLSFFSCRNARTAQFLFISTLNASKAHTHTHHHRLLIYSLPIFCCFTLITFTNYLCIVWV